MRLVTDEIRAQLDANGKAREEHYATSEDVYDPEPVCKFFNPVGLGVWLIAWADPDEPRRLFGLCDLGSPELGFVHLDELEGAPRTFGLGIERDIHWTPHGTIMEYARRAWKLGDIRKADSELYREWFASLPGKERAEIAGAEWPCPDCGEADCPAIGTYGSLNCQGEAQGRAA